jgi:phosphate uptake regulator
VSIFQMLFVTQKMLATLLHVFLHPDVYLLISLINVTREMIVMITLVIRILDAHNP